MQFSFWQVYYCNSAISFFDGFRSLPCFSATSKRRTAVGLLLRLFREIFAVHRYRTATHSGCSPQLFCLVTMHGACELYLSTHFTQCAPLRYSMCQSFNAVRRVVAPYDICNIKHEKGKPSFLFTLRKLLTSVFHLIPTPANKKRKAQRLPLSNFLYYCSLKCTSPVSASMPSTIASDSS